MKKLLLIDGNAIFHRAFHALPLLHNSKGEYTNAVYGFLKMLFDSIQMSKPDYLAIAFDHKDPTFRHQEFTDYKANRSAPPPELYLQQPRLFEVLEALHIPLFQISGFEADDLIGTLAAQAEQQDLHTLILTGDKDTFQLVNDRVEVITPQKGMSQSTTYNIAKVIEKTGLRPDQIIDYKALRGDASDNIPGVKGIGDKQAVELLQKYQTLDNIYSHLDQLTPGQRNKLTENKETAYLSQRMATILCDLPVQLNLAQCAFHDIPEDRTGDLINELEFRSLLRPYELYKKYVQDKLAESKQPSLF